MNLQPALRRETFSNVDHRGNAGFLAGIERVIGHLLEDDQRPLIDPVVNLLDQFALGAEVEQPRGGVARIGSERA